MILTRRTALGMGLALLAGPALADETVQTTDAAPPASDAAAWSAYEARLRSRLNDGGGGRFDEPGARAALAYTNRIREDAGAAGLDWSDELAETARAHAADLAHRDYVEHLSPEGFDPSHRFWLVSRTTIGSPSENIGYHHGGDGPAAAAGLVEHWRTSPGHWGNLLRGTHSDAGYGLVRSGDRAWLVGLYARPLARLSEPLPFRANGPQIGRALRSLSSDIRPGLAVPQGSRLGKVEGAPPVMQITALRLVAPGTFDVVGGPIFLAAG